MHFTVEAQNFAKPYLTAGNIAVDATCGNGFDTLFLAELVGSTGMVYGVDIQSRAIETVKAKLLAAGTLQQCRLAVGSHSQLNTIIGPEHAGSVSVVMFNLGYLPLGDKSIVTKPETTLAGLDQAFEILRPGGFLSVLAYPGHPGGLEESQCVADWITKHTYQLQILRFQDPKNSNSPILWSLTKL
jgi:predicted methyltransferase